MGYGDLTPSGWYHPKRPLSRKQIEKLRRAYAKADIIRETVAEKEKKEQEKTKTEMDAALDDLPL